MKRLELIHIKYLMQCLTHSKYLINGDDDGGGSGGRRRVYGP